MLPDDRNLGNCRLSQVGRAPVHLAVIWLRAADSPLARNALRRRERQQVHPEGWPDATIPGCWQGLSPTGCKLIYSVHAC